MNQNSGNVTRRQFLRVSGALGGGMVLGRYLFSRTDAASMVRAATKKRALVIALPSSPETIDPHQFRAVLTASALAPMVEGLLTRDPETMELQPLLAESYRNIDPHTWEFKLRRGIRFHNGEEFTAEAVKFSIERIFSPNLNTLGKVVWPPSFGQQVRIVDRYTVRIITEVPDPIVPNRLAAESLNMAPPGALGAFKDKYVVDRVVGTGPYRFVEYVPGERLVMEANPNYWGPKPATERIEWHVIPDDATRVAALQRGVVDIIVNLPVPLIPTVTRDRNLRVYSVLGSTVHGLILNTLESQPLQDRRVRQALNHAVDRQAILDNVYGGRGQLLNSVVARQVTNSIDPGGYAYDPGRARQLLADAGYRGGFDLTLYQAIGRWPQAEEAAELIAGYFEQIGVRTDLRTLEWGEYNRRAGLSLLKDAFYYAFVNGSWDPSYLTQRFLSSYPSFRYFNAQGDLEAAIVAYEKTFDPEERRSLAAKIQRYLHDEAVWVFLWQLNENFGVNSRVKGFKMRPDHLIWLRDAYVEE